MCYLVLLIYDKRIDRSQQLDNLTQLDPQVIWIVRKFYEGVASVIVVDSLEDHVSLSL